MSNPHRQRNRDISMAGYGLCFFVCTIKKTIEISPVGACMEYIKMLSCYLIKI